MKRPSDHPTQPSVCAIINAAVWLVSKSVAILARDTERSPVTEEQDAGVSLWREGTLGKGVIWNQQDRTTKDRDEISVHGKTNNSPEKSGVF